MRNKLLYFFLVLTVVSGAAFIYQLNTVFIGWQFYQGRQLASPTEQVATSSSEVTVTSLLIPALDTQIPIISVKVENPVDITQILKSNLVWDKSTVLPGGSGTAVIFGHNWKNMLKDLDQLEVGQELIVTLSNQEKVIFKVTDLKIVTQKEITLPSTPQPQLLVYTCYGWWDQQRLLVYAVLVA